MKSPKLIAAAVAMECHSEEELTRELVALECLGVFLKKKKWDKLLQNTLIPIEERTALLKKCTETVQMPALVESCVQYLLEIRRMAWFPRIIRALKLVRERQYGVIDGEVTTVLPLGEQEQGHIAMLFERMTGKQVRFRAIIDPNILGGGIFRSGDLQYDASIAGKLRRLKQQTFV